MINRIRIYLREMYPFWSRLLVASSLFLAVYLLVVVIGDVKNITIGYQEAIVILTVFTLLLSLRIADEFKDYDTDKINFPKRPLPSGRVYKKDLIILLLTFQIPTIILNILFMNNTGWFIGLWIYGLLMSFWFFIPKIIKHNLILALITHNPIQIVLMAYIVTFITNKYNIALTSYDAILIVIALYLPALIYEIGRKIRAPKKETVYTTYSKIMGYKTAVNLMIFLYFINTLINSYLLSYITIWALVPLWLLFIYSLVRSINFMKNPNKHLYDDIMKFFIYAEQTTLLVITLGYLLFK